MNGKTNVTMKNRQNNRKVYRVFNLFENRVKVRCRSDRNQGYVCSVDNSEELFTTNETGGDPLSIMLDSGFSSGCVCGDVTFRKAMAQAPRLAKLDVELPTELHFRGGQDAQLHRDNKAIYVDQEY